MHRSRSSLQGRVAVSGASDVLRPPSPRSDPAPRPSAAAAVDSPRTKSRGQDVPVPGRKKYVAPEYPAAAAAEGIRGIVILDVEIGEDGKVEITEGHPLHSGP